VVSAFELHSEHQEKRAMKVGVAFGPVVGAAVIRVVRDALGGVPVGDALGLAGGAADGNALGLVVGDAVATDLLVWHTGEIQEGGSNCLKKSSEVGSWVRWKGSEVRRMR
jgi:hypothetical protein